MSETDELLQNAAAYAEGFDKAGLEAAPAKKVTVLACMDARVIPTRILGLEEGDAHVIRNAGGVVTDDAIRSIAISQHMLGTEEIVLLHHTGCGMLGFTDDELRQRLKEDAGQEPSWPVHTFSDLEASVRESIQRIRESPFIPKKASVRGFVYEVEGGRVREVA